MIVDFLIRRDDSMPPEYPPGYFRRRQEMIRLGCSYLRTISETVTCCGHCPIPGRTNRSEAATAIVAKVIRWLVPNCDLNLCREGNAGRQRTGEQQVVTAGEG